VKHKSKSLGLVNQHDYLNGNGKCIRPWTCRKSYI